MGRMPDDPELPQGVLTFLLTDIEGSTPWGSGTARPWAPP
jgi:hypothetical protein